jgi:hypothetical protein
LIGLSRVTPWRWLLPPARGLTPAGVVVVVAAVRSGTDAYCSTMSLASAFAHVLLPEGRRAGFVDQAESKPSVHNEVLDARLDRYCIRV